MQPSGVGVLELGLEGAVTQKKELPRKTTRKSSSDIAESHKIPPLLEDKVQAPFLV